ncbi:MAG: transposase [Desulfobulbaceae bacterium]|jgi:putative transposase|nr:transposase [Desulfobulbaceae bacterium]
MPRIARLIAPGIPHQVTQRGNRRMETFFCDQDYQDYLDLMAEWCAKCHVSVWAYCLMPNHIHLIAVPESEDGLRRAIGEAHRRYSLMINRRQGWTGHLWQGRFASFPMDEKYLLAAAKYIETNPVRAHLVPDPYAWNWSSAKAHAAGMDDMLVKVAPLLERVGAWQSFLSEADQVDASMIRRHERTGRALGGDEFLGLLETSLMRPVKLQKAGRKKNADK